MNLIYKAGYFFILYWFAIECSSCSSSKELQYLQNNIDTAGLHNVNLPDHVVQKGDILSINVHSDNPSAAAIFNQNTISRNPSLDNISTTPFTSQQRIPEYLVDLEGKITFPVIGKIKVQGLTKPEIAKMLDEKLIKYLSNPYYDIRFVNFKVTLIGEVAKPGVYNIPNESVNILEAIALAGDLTFYGKRDNVLVIREKNGQRQFGRLDLRNNDLFKSEYYSLQQNDIIIVDMSKKKISANDQVAFRNISLAATVISAIAVLFSVLR